jgi:hydrophobe/amphiphile efflux-1 (HAE1) family protein
MRFIDLATRRVVGCSLLAFGVGLLGIYSYGNLVVATWPAIDLPTIVVSANLPGASPETMASTVATPLERRLGRLASVTEIASSSSIGNTLITIQFSYGRDVDGAANDVQSAISAATADLPKEMPQRPVYKKVNPSVAPVALIAVTSETLPVRELYGYADTVVRQRLSELNGVGATAIQGASRASIRISVNPEAIAALGLGLDDIGAAIQRSSMLRPSGSVDGVHQTVSVGVDDQLSRAGEFGSLVINTSNGAPLRLSDVADIKEDTSDNRVEGRYNGRPAVFVFVIRKAGANIVQTVEQVKDALPAVKRWLPASVDLSLVIDRADEIKGTLDDFKLLLVITMGLVVVLVFVFLRDIYTTMIACISIPISLCGTFCVLQVMGYGLDVISLLALMLATGFVVDDAVVVIENISTFREGRSSDEAVTLAVRQIGSTIVAITVSLVAAFAPFLFFSGVVGILLREFAVTLCSAIVISGVVSLTLTPALCRHLLKDERRERTSHISERLKSAYARSLRSALDFPRSVLALTIAVAVATIVLFGIVPKGFLPTQDSGTIYGITDGPPDVSFVAMAEQQREISQRLLQDKDVRDVSMLVGGEGSTSGIRTARFFVGLKPPGTRDNVRAVIARLRGTLATIPFSSTFLVPIEDINVGAREGKGKYQYTLRGPNWQAIQGPSRTVLDRLRRLPSIKDVGSDFETGGLQLSLFIDRDKAAKLGITPKSLDEALFSAFGQRQIALLYTSIEQQQAILEVSSPVDQQLGNLDRVYLKGVGGLQIPLRAVSSVAEEPSSLAVTHQGEFPAITITFNLADEVSLSKAVEDIENAVKKIDLDPNVRTSFEGQAGAFKSFSGSEPYLILGALAAVYIVLGILYESFAHPLTIISSLPPAGFGALSALWLTRFDLSFIAFIGIILLVGIVKKNAILVVDFAIKANNSRVTAADAVFQACVQRVRPIVMTNAIGVLTALPLIFTTGIGSNLRQPLGVALAGGLIVSLALTLYSTPVIYLHLEKWRRSTGKKLNLFASASGGSR